MWYGHYITKSIVVEDGGSSAFWNRYFTKGFVDRIGKVNRFVNYRNKEFQNSSFAQFCATRKRVIPDSYRMIFARDFSGFSSISKYDKFQPVLDERIWKLSGDWTLNHFLCKMGKSIEISKDCVLDDMDKTTSCGYPWSLQFHKKSEFLASPSAQVLDDYWAKLALPEDTIVPIWTCSQKIEMRPLAKVLANNVRTFTASPIEHSYATNRLCLDFNTRFYASANETWSFVGCSKYSGGFDNLVSRLTYGSVEKSQVKDSNAFELDESEYDSSIFERALIGQRDLRWAMMSPVSQTIENRCRLWKLYDSIVHSVIVLENGELCQKHTGNPSGSANTIVDNTMILFRLFAYAFIELAVEQGIAPSYEYFMTHVEAALNGDDNTFTTSDVVVGWFHPAHISRVWTAIGVTTKTPCESPRKITDCEFLSQGFVWDKDVQCWLPSPETEKVLCSLMWGSSCDDPRWHLLRAHALRIDSFGNKECRAILADYIDYLNMEFKEQLHGALNGLTMLNIRAVWKSDDWLSALYAGTECDGGKVELSSLDSIDYVDAIAPVGA